MPAGTTGGLVTTHSMTARGFETHGTCSFDLKNFVKACMSEIKC
jgi:hypothetical protein